jgi:hypothetical protein
MSNQYIATFTLLKPGKMYKTLMNTEFQDK